MHAGCMRNVCGNSINLPLKITLATSCSWQYFKTVRKPAYELHSHFIQFLHMYLAILIASSIICLTTFKTSAVFKIGIVYHKGGLGNTPYLA